MSGLDVLGVMDDNPLVVTPGYILDRMNRFNAAINTFQKDVWRALPGPTQPFSLAFGAFKIEWDKFYQSNGAGASGWLSRLSGSTMDSVINYERRLDEWKAKFREVVASQGGDAKNAVTDPTKPQAKPEDWSTAKKVAVGAVVIGVAGAGLYLGRAYVSRFVPTGIMSRINSMVPKEKE